MKKLVFKPLIGYEGLYVYDEMLNVYSIRKNGRFFKLKVSNYKHTKKGKHYYYPCYILYKEDKQHRLYLKDLKEQSDFNKQVEKIEKSKPVIKPLEEKVESKKNELGVIDIIVFAMGMILGHIITKII